MVFCPGNEILIAEVLEKFPEGEPERVFDFLVVIALQIEADPMTVKEKAEEISGAITLALDALDAL